MAGSTKATAAWLADLQHHCAQRLGRIKQPTAVYLLDTLPRSPTGKLLRRLLREQLAPFGSTGP